MIRKSLINLFFAFLLLLSLSLILRETFKVRSNGINESKVNLAIRQTAHKLLIELGDSTSRVDKVIHNKNNFTFTISNKINYDTLPHLLQSALTNHNIENDYYLTLKECEHPGILWGFQKQSFLDDNIACLGREFEKNCNVITVTIQEEKSALNSNLLLFYITTALISLLVLWFSFKKNKQKFIEPHRNTESNFMSIGKYQFDHSSQVLKINARELSLTFRESKLLEFLVSNENSICTREEILKNVWEDEGVLVGRSLDVFISRLRKKLVEDSSIEIKNVHSVGYKLQVTK